LTIFCDSSALTLFLLAVLSRDSHGCSTVDVADVAVAAVAVAASCAVGGWDLGGAGYEATGGGSGWILDGHERLGQAVE